MKRVPASDFVRHFSEMCDESLQHPIVMTRNGRDRLVVVGRERLGELLALALKGVDEKDRRADFDSAYEILFRSNG